MVIELETAESGEIHGPTALSKCTRITSPLLNVLEENVELLVPAGLPFKYHW